MDAVRLVISLGVLYMKTQVLDSEFILPWPVGDAPPLSGFFCTWALAALLCSVDQFVHLLF